MTFNELISLCEPIHVSGSEPNSIGILTQDSRKVNSNSIFIAVRGYNVDGHSFIKDAISRGASVIISEEPVDTEEEICIIQVPDTRSLVGPLAQALKGDPADKLNIIGITGTNGKTTVATLTYQVLEKLGTTPSLLGTVTKRIAGKETGSKLTTSDPIELASDMQKMVEANSTHLVMEVSSHALDQERVGGINFDVAAFTNLSHDHLDYHENLTAYAKAKKRLFDGLSPDAQAIINGDDDQAQFMGEDCEARILYFSFKEALDVDCQILDNTINGLVIRINKMIVESPLVGNFNAYNLAEAFLICQALGYEDADIAAALKIASGAPGRLERVEGSGDGNPVVLVDYAHTPDALENVASTLAELKEEDQHLHIVFGCGGNRDRTKRPEMAQIAENYGDQITVTSDNPRDENPDTIIDEIMAGFEDPGKINRITDRRQAIMQAIAAADAKAMILIAGKGHETYQEIKGERHDFDDRQIAREALGRRNGNPKNEVA
ncbi:MAG TPA: UDP-N-acetylmuramoyl-L-alanyl-D-glutamate--2,6-diaminopimelate ligase [Balneolaceae bacterium]|nr:UDP-N-acetylmuramoyl-L-alanyl-D-glutamate--2,6-diaminopimelate ligase [Balneolaceae bacterium]